MGEKPITLADIYAAADENKDQVKHEAFMQSVLATFKAYPEKIEVIIADVAQHSWLYAYELSLRSGLLLDGDDDLEISDFRSS